MISEPLETLDELFQFLLNGAVDANSAPILRSKIEAAIAK